MLLSYTPDSRCGGIAMTWSLGPLTHLGTPDPTPIKAQNLTFLLYLGLHLLLRSDLVDADARGVRNAFR